MCLDLLDHANGVVTPYTYDPKTFRLTRLPGFEDDDDMVFCGVAPVNLLRPPATC